MIVYFADRKMQVLGNASTGLPKGFTAFDDKKVEDVDTGVASFECTVSFKKEDRMRLQEVVKAGNYLLRSHGSENEFYTIIDVELDVDKQEIDIYAEDAGLDLLNDVAQEFEADKVYPVSWYVEKWIADSGFEIGINEISSLTRKLKWEGESTVTERLASVATQFDNAEIGYSFEIDGLRVVHKFVNIYKKRGKDIGEQLRINKNLNNMVIKSSVANLATALYVTGGTPEGKDDPITLSGYKYDDGDFYVSGKYLKSRKAVAKWSRYLSESGTGEGHIEKTYSFDTTSQKELCNHAVTELKKICDTEVNYEVDIAELPLNTKIGDRVNLVDDRGEIYLSARILKLETSVTNETQKATLGEYLIKDSGISEKVEALASQFAEMAKNKTYYTWIAYADDMNGNGITLEPEGKEYIGISANRSKEEPDLTDPSVYKWSKVQGETGVSLTGIVEHYLVSSESDGITVETEGWVSSPVPVMTSENRYLWNYETLVYSNGKKEDLSPKIIGTYGDKGDKSPSIVTMTEQYYLSDSSTELLGSEWVRTMPTWAEGKYLWTRWCTEWDAPNPELLTYSEPVLAKTFNEIHETANDAEKVATEAKEKADSTEKQVTEVNAEIDKANKEIEGLTENLKTLSNDMSVNYATKGELTEVNAALETKIAQNAAEISTTASKVQDIEVDANKAITDALAAQKAADEAANKALEAQNKYDELKEQADVTDEQLEAAKKAVEKAQQDAMAAGDAAAAAQSMANSLVDRVTTAESNITQNAEQINQMVSKVENMKIGGRNLVLGSDIMEESSLYGFGERELSLELEPGAEYVFTVNGRVNEGDEGHYLLSEIAAQDGFFRQEVIITENEDTVRSVLFTAPSDIGQKVVKVKFYYTPQVAEGMELAGSCTVNWCKLEKGNKATDWTPAPEDGKGYTDNKISEATTQILQTAEDVTIGILSGYTTESDLEEYKKEVENLFKASEDGFSFEFSQLEQKITNVSNEIIERNQFIRLEEGNIIIGKSDSPIQARFTNDSLEFLYNDQTVAKFTNEVLEVHNISVDNQIRFGSTWAIRPGRSGNLNDVWIGG